MVKLCTQVVHDNQKYVCKIIKQPDINKCLHSSQDREILVKLNFLLTPPHNLDDSENSVAMFPRCNEALQHKYLEVLHQVRADPTHDLHELLCQLERRWLETCKIHLNVCFLEINLGEILQFLLS